jgi:DNA-binding Lrp family transcriptional regulator
MVMERILRENITSLDCQIIESLQKDGRLPNTEIAKRLGISETTVRTRLQRLIQGEYIQIVAASSPLKLGPKAVGTEMSWVLITINNFEETKRGGLMAQ